jgi:hypothetical protein
MKPKHIRRRHACALWLLSLSATLGIVAVSAGADAPLAGSQGTDTALPATPSQLTVSGRGQFAGLQVTVNQTRDLVTQAVSVTWTGGVPTVQGPGLFGRNFIQIMQCWGEDDGSVPSNPGPPPEQCAMGAAGARYGAGFDVSLPNLFAWTRVISRPSWGNFDPNVGVVDPLSSNVWQPFRAVDGTEIDVQINADFNPAIPGGNFWLNPYFNIITSNEIPAARTGPDGRGAELFKVDSGLDAPGLGCGQRVQSEPDGSKRRPTCWIVIVPRGEPSAENAGTPFANSADQFGVGTSPLSPSVWANRIAIPIEFRPVESPCALSSIERRITGTELLAAAISNWQPALCAQGSLPPFSFANVNDATARQQLLSGQAGAPGLIAVQRPFPAGTSTPSAPIVYAPLTASGLVIGFNVERIPKVGAPPEAEALAGVRVAQLNLTPRLVAKLITQSYVTQVTVGNGQPGYPWLASNPAHLSADPDFIRFNPEFALLQTGDSRTFSGLQLPAGNSDAAQQLWEWILADDEATGWLAGTPDEWGMVVNPYFSTDAGRNPSGIAFGTPIPTSFPKAEPYCFQAPDTTTTPPVRPPLLCGTDWMPYNRGFYDSARIARVAFDNAPIAANPFAMGPSDYWKRDAPQSIARKSMLSLTDSPSARVFGLQMARLSRADDNGSNRTFIAPDAAGLIAGVGAMREGAVAGVLEPKPQLSAPGAYPLTTITYAAIRPLSLDMAQRNDYASFLTYVSSAGQTPGINVGQLPLGYVPLPQVLAARTAAAAETVRTLTAPPPTTTTIRPVTTQRPTNPYRPPSTLPSVVTTLETIPSATTTSEPSPSSTTTSEPEDGGTAAGSTTTSTVLPAETTTPSTTVAPVTAPVDPPGTRMAVLGLGVVAVGSALGALEITKRARRYPASEVVPLEPLVGA